MLEPRRADRDFFSGDIKQDMFQYLEYSRCALADITLNFNVAYELNARDRARGFRTTALFRQQTQSPLPFAISSHPGFAYDPEDTEGSRALITRVLTELLVMNPKDSPVQIALAQQAKLGS